MKADKSPSAREIAQNEIVAFLEQNATIFNAPYGILSGMQAIGQTHGKLRVVTFGVSGYLDAVVEVWSPVRLVVRGQGGLSYKVDGEYSSTQALIDHLSKEWKLENKQKPLA